MGHFNQLFVHILVFFFLISIYRVKTNTTDWIRLSLKTLQILFMNKFTAQTNVSN